MRSIDQAQEDAQLSQLERQLGAHDVHRRPRRVHRRRRPQGRRSAGDSLAVRPTDGVARNLVANLRKPLFESLDLLVHVLSTQAGERSGPGAAGVEVKGELRIEASKLRKVYQRGVDVEVAEMAEKLWTMAQHGQSGGKLSVFECEIKRKLKDFQWRVLDGRWRGGCESEHFYNVCYSRNRSGTTKLRISARQTAQTPPPMPPNAQSGSC